MSKEEYENLTMTEIALIKKAYEDMTVNETSFMRNAVLNAIANGFSKKRKKYKLWQKKQKKETKEKVQEYKNDIKQIMEIEKKEQGWLEMIYKNAGRTLKKQNKKQR